MDPWIAIVGYSLVYYNAFDFCVPFLEAWVSCHTQPCILVYDQFSSHFVGTIVHTLRFSPKMIIFMRVVRPGQVRTWLNGVLPILHSIIFFSNLKVACTLRKFF